VCVCVCVNVCVYKCVCVLMSYLAPTQQKVQRTHLLGHLCV
jgi:hypothetical protein